MSNCGFLPELRYTASRLSREQGHHIAAQNSGFGFNIWNLPQLFSSLNLPCHARKTEHDARRRNAGKEEEAQCRKGVRELPEEVSRKWEARDKS